MVQDTPLGELPELVVLSTRDGGLAAYVAPARGAELVGLELVRGDQRHELLYRGRDFRPAEGWSGRAPILWPATGRNYLEASGDNPNAPGWSHRGVRYPMSIHGFARNRPWRVNRIEGSADQALVSLVLTDDPETRENYPFGFRLQVDYVLAGATLAVRHTVMAASSNDSPMPFSIGNHITFRIPLAPGGEAERMTIQTPATLRLDMDAAGKPTGQVTPDDRFFTPFPLTALQPLTVYALGGYAGEPHARLVDPAGVAVTLSHRFDRTPSGVPVLFNFWGDPAAGFFSPEPWVGKQNSLASGDGAILLAPGEQFRWTLTIRVEDTR